MPATVTILDTETGKMATYEDKFPEGPWSKGDEYLWTDGNFGCDCNRHIFFAQARGEGSAEERKCGDDRFQVQIVCDGVTVLDEITCQPEPPGC